MVDFIKLHTLSSICWYRLTAEVVNIRVSPAMKSTAIEIFEGITKDISYSLWSGQKPLATFFHLKNRRYNTKVEKHDKFLFEVFFCQHTLEDVVKWANALQCYLDDPVKGKNYALINPGKVEERCLDRIIREQGVNPSPNELCLDFLTPFPFEHRRRTFITKRQFIEAFIERFQKLFGRADIACEYNNDDFTVLPYFWDYTEIKHLSQSQPGSRQLVNGCVGRIYLKGNMEQFLPFILLGSELHTGLRIANSQGYFRLYGDSTPFFEKDFQNRKAMLTAVQDVIERYDHALEALSAEAGLSFREDLLADDLLSKIRNEQYTPAPYTAFQIKKKSGEDRLIEQPHYKDVMIQQFLLRMTSAFFDKMFEEDSIGFRKGVSRQKAVEMVREAVSEGFEYVIESDIEDFFTSVDLERLLRIIDSCLPGRDGTLRNLLGKILKTGYVLNGILCPRTRGLAQGSPLSPILANLYLNSFDEHVSKWPVRMVRYADDFIILTRSREDADNILSETEAYLSEIGLKLKKAKTGIKAVNDGFQFLGFTFLGCELFPGFEEETKALKKPLYITEPYHFLSLSGDSLDIRSHGQVLQSIPLRRISEVMVMEKAVFSTALLRRCVDEHVPVTLTLNNGYYVTTIKPDSKRYFDIAMGHARKYCSLSDTEYLALTKEFAAGKVHNYIQLFKQRYSKGMNLFIDDLAAKTQDIYQAASIEQVRGYEGATARLVYQRLNTLIDDPDFHIIKRERKNPDRINSLFNFGYYLLFSRVNVTVRAIGLNPYLGFLHSPENNYESLVCDIEELFRSRIDRLIIRILNLKIIKKDDFQESVRGFHLQREAARRFIDQFEAEMKRRTSDHILSLEESIHAQVRVIRDYFIESRSLSFYRWEV